MDENMVVLPDTVLEAYWGAFVQIVRHDTIQYSVFDRWMDEYSKVKKKSTQINHVHICLQTDPVEQNDMRARRG